MSVNPTFSDTQYLFSHGHTPRTSRDGGMSRWGFEVIHANGAKEQYWLTTRTYSEAKRTALKMSKAAGARRVSVLP